MENNMNDMIPGDLSAPDPAVSSKTKFIAISVIVFVAVSSIVLVLNTGANPQDQSPVAGNVDNGNGISAPVTTKKAISESDKIRILNSLSAGTTTTSATKTTKSVTGLTAAEKARQEEALNEKKLMLQSVFGTTTVPVLSMDEKLKLLKALENQ